MKNKYKVLDFLFIGLMFILCLSLIGLSTYFSLKVYDKSANAYVVNDNLLSPYWRDISNGTYNYRNVFNENITYSVGNGSLVKNDYTITLSVASGSYSILNFNNLNLDNDTYTISGLVSSNRAMLRIFTNSTDSIYGTLSVGDSSFTFNGSIYQIYIYADNTLGNTTISNIKLENGSINTGFVIDNYAPNGFNNGFISGANSNSSIYKLGDLYATIENDLQYQLDILLPDYSGFIASDFVINVNGNYNYPFIYYKVVGARYITIYSQNKIDNIDSVNVLTDNFLDNNNVIMLWLFTDSEDNVTTLNVRTSSVYEIINPPRYVYMIDNVNAYTIAYRNGFIAGSDVNTQLYNSGYNDGVDHANNTLNTSSLSYFKGREDGIETANTYSFYTLMDAVMVTPVKYAFEVFNFDFFGINVKSLLTTLFTMCLFAFILKLCLKFIGV